MLILNEKNDNWHYVRSLFCWSWLGGWDIFRKRGVKRKKEHYFGNSWFRHHCTLVLRFEEHFMQSFFIVLWWMKALFAFIPWLLSSFGLPGYGSESKKRCTLRLLLMCLKELELLEVVLLERGQMAYLGNLGDWGIERNYAN